MDANRLMAPLVLGLAAAVVVLALLPRLTPASIQSAAPGEFAVAAKGITVAGTGRVTIKPDMALVRLGVQTQGGTAEQAQQANAQKMDAVVRTLKGLGIADKDVQTSSVSLRPIYEQGRDVNRQQIVGYEASNIVAVRITDLTLVGTALDEVVKVGANTAGGIRFGLQNDAPQRQEALKKAVQDAQGKAEAIATAAGRTLGAADSITEQSVSTPQPLDAMRTMEAAAVAPTPIEPGEMEITASVRVGYGF